MHQAQLSGGVAAAPQVPVPSTEAHLRSLTARTQAWPPELVHLAGYQPTTARNGEVSAAAEQRQLCPSGRQAELPKSFFSSNRFKSSETSPSQSRIVPRKYWGVAKRVQTKVLSDLQQVHNKPMALMTPHDR